MGQLNSPPCLPLLLALLTASIPAAPAADPGPIGLIVEPAFAAGPISHPIEGARETVLVPARRTTYGFDRFTETEWADEGLDWPDVFPEAMRLAEALSDQLQATLVRDERQVILYAEITSEEPFLSSIVFTDGFRDRFRTTLGRELIVVIPERNRLFVFPRFGNRLSDFAPAIAARHRESGIPVSLEVFAVDAKGCRVIGQVQP